MLALPLLALLLAAPPPEQTRAEALLASSRPIDKAWGAYLAGQLELTPLIPSLISELDRLRPIPTPSELESWSLAHILLGALIELKAPLSVEQLKPWLDKYQSESLILLLLDADRNQSALFELRPILAGSHWLAVTNTLLRQRAPGIGAAILAETKAEHRLGVYDSEKMGSPGGGGSYFSARHPIQFAKGFPPAAYFQIVVYPKTGDTLLAPGPEDVYLRRIVVPTDGRSEWNASSGEVNSQTEHIKYVASISGRSTAEVGKVFEAGTSIDWTTPDAFVEAARKALQVQANAIRGIAARFIENGLLTTAELAGIRIQIVPQIEDKRKNQSIPLRAIPPFPVDLTSP
jgi:hypothetical protein